MIVKGGGRWLSRRTICKTKCKQTTLKSSLCISAREVNSLQSCVGRAEEHREDKANSMFWKRQRNRNKINLSKEKTGVPEMSVRLCGCVSVQKARILFCKRGSSHPRCGSFLFLKGLFFGTCLALIQKRLSQQNHLPCCSQTQIMFQVLKYLFPSFSQRQLGHITNSQTNQK